MHKHDLIYGLYTGWNHLTTNLTEVTVVKGDTLFKISRRYGVTVDDLVRWNGIKNRNLIHPGQHLKI